MGTMTKLMLYVEDNPDHADLVLHSLRQRAPDARVVHVEDGDAALRYLEQNRFAAESRPALILLDLRLPKVDGFEVLRTVKSTPGLSNIPVVVLTTSSSPRDVARSYEYCANSYLVKPADYAALDALLKELSHYWLWSNIAPGPEAAR